MLDAWLIDLLKKEQEKRKKENRPVLPVPETPKPNDKDKKPS